MRATSVRAFLPDEAKPAQVFIHGGDEVRFAAITIQIFVAQDQSASELPDALLSGPKGARMPQMEIACWRWSDAAARPKGQWHGRTCNRSAGSFVVQALACSDVLADAGLHST